MILLKDFTAMCTIAIMTGLTDWCFYYFHFTDEETETQRGQGMFFPMAHLANCVLRFQILGSSSSTCIFFFFLLNLEHTGQFVEVSLKQNLKSVEFH